MKTYRPVPPGWTIRHNPKPIPDRRHDWDFWHQDYEPGDLRHGTAASYDEALDEIGRIIADELTQSAQDDGLGY